MTTRSAGFALVALLAGVPITSAIGASEHAGHDDDRGPAPTDQAHDEHDDHEDHGADGRGHDDHGSRDDHDEHGHDAEPFAVETFEQHGVRLGTAGPGRVDVGIDLPGEVRPNGDRIAHLAPRFPGLVREVRAHIGDTVSAGSVLAIIEGDNLVRYPLKAELAGTVIDKHITPGEAVTRDKAAFIIVDLTTVWVDVTVYQNVLPRLRVGQPVVVTTRTGEPHAESTIAYVSPVVDQTTRTATARVVLPNPEQAWRPGLFVTATIFEPVQAAVAVPRRALHTFEGASVVFAVEDDHFVPRRVTVGATGHTTVEITAGLASGDRFADEKSFLVKADLAKGSVGHHH